MALAWLAVYVPSYAIAYPLSNFLFLCNLCALLTGLALWRGDVLLLSSQAVGLPVIGAAWTVDVLCRLLTGHHLIGGTAYMWDASLPLFTRLLSTYHVGAIVLPAGAAATPPRLPAQAGIRCGRDRGAMLVVQRTFARVRGPAVRSGSNVTRVTIRGAGAWRYCLSTRAQRRSRRRQPADSSGTAGGTTGRGDAAGRRAVVSSTDSRMSPAPASRPGESGSSRNAWPRATATTGFTYA